MGQILELGYPCALGRKFSMKYLEVTRKVRTFATIIIMK